MDDGPQDSLGVWLTTVDSQVLTSPDEALRASRWLAEQGFRRAALPLYTDGAVLWSATAQRNRLGIPRSGNTLGDADLRRLLLDLRRRGLETVGWFEYGLMAHSGAPWLRGQGRLQQQDPEGRTRWRDLGGTEMVWLNPAVPEVRQALVDLIIDACTQLPLDWIQLDDHFAWPVGVGYDPFTLAAWRQSRWGRTSPSPPLDAPGWTFWRGEQLTALLRAIRTAMARECPGVRLSLSPHPQPISSALYLADWLHWARMGLVDELVVQLYQGQPLDVAEVLEDPSLQQAARVVPLRIGLLAGLRTQPRSTEALRQELQLVQSRGYRGIDLFFYESVRDKGEAWMDP